MHQALLYSSSTSLITHQLHLHKLTPFSSSRRRLLPNSRLLFLYVQFLVHRGRTFKRRYLGYLCSLLGKSHVFVGKVPIVVPSFLSFSRDSTIHCRYPEGYGGYYDLRLNVKCFDVELDILLFTSNESPLVITIKGQDGFTFIYWASNSERIDWMCCFLFSVWVATPSATTTLINTVPSIL